MFACVCPRTYVHTRMSAQISARTCPHTHVYTRVYAHTCAQPAVEVAITRPQGQVAIPVSWQGQEGPTGSSAEAEAEAGL